MLETLIQFVLQLVVTISDFILSPFLNAIFSLFPSVGEYFTYIMDFLTTAFTYISTILQWLCFTPSMFMLLFDYFIIKYSIYLITVTTKFAISMYNKFKP